MLVMKFGGSSVADARQIQKVLEIVRGRIARRPVVVASAHKGMTDLLIQAAHRAAEGEVDATALIERQRGVLRGVGADEWMLDPYFREIEDVLRGVSLVREASPRVLDFIAGFGERMSVRVIAYHFQRQGLAAEAYDAWDLGFVTDDAFGSARPLAGYEAGMAAAFAAKVPSGVVPVVTGFVGRTLKGEPTTVGRNGSDYSATVIAAGAGAEECEIWTDTDGVMTSDPNLVPAARNIPVMSFAEASELAYYGGRVLHPATLLPAVEKNIPVRVLNTNRPEHPGTVITGDGAGAPVDLTSIAYKNNQAVLTISSARMLGQSGFLARVFEVVGRHAIDVDMIATSEVSVSMTTRMGPALDRAADELARLGEVSVARGRALVCVVGRSLASRADLSERVFAALSRAGVVPDMISRGASAINLSLVVPEADVRRLVPEIHARLFDA